MTPSDDDFLETAAVIARSREETIKAAAERVRREMERHRDSLEHIRWSHADANRALAGVLEEARRRKIPQSVLSEKLGLSRQRLHRIRQAQDQ